ncbi:sensor histidine kinase [Streptomyces graminilatus]|uniref:sensor histidine kinase n=1 Tax=Streptomyces graminilatus TaxID=1464070 RepID=UPI0006E314E8|nr:HAMP domain-containing sensor histidine kinase [Streptomyces graminilatus]
MAIGALSAAVAFLLPLLPAPSDASAQLPPSHPGGTTVRAAGPVRRTGAAVVVALPSTVSAEPDRQADRWAEAVPASSGRQGVSGSGQGGGREVSGIRRTATRRSDMDDRNLLTPASAVRVPDVWMNVTVMLILLLLLALLGLGGQLRRERDLRRKTEQRLLEFLATAGHELRTPLTAISGYVQLARMGGLNDPEKHDLVMSRMTDETRRMSALLDELVLLTRLGLGQPLRRETVNLAPLCRDAVADARACAPLHPIRLTILPGNHTVTGDADRLYQAVANLLANVRHHTPKGTFTALGLGTEDGHRVIEVIDNGPGIPAELRTAVFERFVRGEQPAEPGPDDQAMGGSGLGLSVVAAIVSAHGGTVTLEPDAQGAWFRIRLPA